MNEKLNKFINKVNRELGVEITLRKPATVSDIFPLELKDFYCLSDGLSLPFLEIFPANEIRKDGFQGWHAFGFDSFFSYCLYNPNSSENKKFDLWDHESGNVPEGFCSSIIEILEYKYSEIIENEYEGCELFITSIPETTKPPKLITELKKVHSGSSAELLKLIKDLPLILKCKDRKLGIEIIRFFHELEINCHIKI